MLSRAIARARLTGILACFIVLLSSAYCDSPEPDKRLEAKALIDSRQLDSAEKIIVAEMMTAPRDTDWITLLAEVRLGQNRTPEALKLLDDANQIDGITAPRAMLISLAESQAGHMDRAEPPIRTAIRLDPNNAMAHYFLARLLYTDNRFEEAIEESNKTIALAPGFVRAYENLGLCYEGKYETAEAIRWYLKAIEQQASSPNKTEWPLIDLAVLLMQEGKSAEARPYLTQALDINPKNTQALVQMGSLLEADEDLKGALEEYRKAIHSDLFKQTPGQASAYYKAARLCKRLGYKEESTQYFEDFKAVHDKK